MVASSSNREEYSNKSVLVRRRLAVYEDETCRLLLRAFEWAQHQDEKERRLHKRIIGNNTVPVFPKKSPSAVDYSDATLVADCDSESENKSKGSNNSDSDSDEYNGIEILGEMSASLPPTAAGLGAKPDKSPDKTTKFSGKLKRRLIEDINRHSDNLIRIDLPLPTGMEKVDEQRKRNVELHLFPPAALLPQNAVGEHVDLITKANAMKILSEQLSSKSPDYPFVVILLIQSGRFAGGVFQQGKCLAHRATVRYTVRKGQGKAQSTQDGSRRPKSVGSQLRRAGEEQLNIDIKTTMMEWTKKGYIKNASRIFFACPKTMQSTIFSTDVNNGTKINHSGINFELSKNDDRIRKVPFDVGRATFHNVEVVHEVLMGVDLCQLQNHVPPSEGNAANETDNTIAVAETKLQRVARDLDEEKRKREEELALDLPMTPLHISSRDGNLAALMDILSRGENCVVDDEDYLDVDRPAGYDCMTALHFAAAATANVDPITASALVTTLLLQGHADPTILDACGRPPYFLASHDRVREAFRKARAILGEEYCEWDGGARVGPPLTEDDLEAKKEREAEKKRRKKARQKLKKAKAKAVAEEEERRRLVDQKAKQAAEEAKRVRDGLSAKPTGANVCDFCGKVCKGRNASHNMFRRLDYKYCSIECVNKHKRELMAAAAMARFG